MIAMWRELAKKFGDVKFCQIRGDLCIEGYPDRNTPTILAYKDGDIKRQIITLQEINGFHTNLQGNVSSFLHQLNLTYSLALLSDWAIFFYGDIVANVDYHRFGEHSR